MPDRIVRRISGWGKKSKSEEYEIKIQILSRTKWKYDCGNYELEEVEGLVEDKVPHTDTTV